MPDLTFGHDGALAVGLFPSFFYRSTESGLQGIAIDIAAALAERAGLRLATREYPAPPDVVRALAAGECDAAFLGIDPARGGGGRLHAGLPAGGVHLAGPGRHRCPEIAEADGMRVALVRHHAMDTALRGQLLRAERVYAATPDDAFALFCAGQADVLAGIRPGLMGYAARLPGARVLPDCYGANVLALAVAKAQSARLAFVGEFSIVEARGSGLVRRAIDSAGLRGIDVITA